MRGSEKKKGERKKENVGPKEQNCLLMTVGIREGKTGRVMWNKKKEG